jgi:CheY-like chemotaxis protein
MTEPVSQPVFFVVDEDASAVEMLAGDLERRFHADYRVVGETSAAAALERLAALRDAGEQVALIICYESMRAMPGSELLARSRAAHPNAKRILLIDWGDQQMLEVIARGMALGHIEYYLTKPWRPRQHLLYPVLGEAVVAWTRLNSPGFALARIVGDHWDPVSFQLRDALERNNVPYAFHDRDSPEGAELLQQLDQVPDNPVVFLADGRVLTSYTEADIAEALGAAHGLPDVTVVADAGMISEANQKAIEAAGLSFVFGMRIPHVPYVVAQWRREHPGEQIPDGHVFTQPWPAGPNGGRRDQVIYYQYRHDRARRTLRGIDEQVKKAEQAVAGNAPVKRNRFIQLTGGTRSVNRDLEAKARTLAGLKGYITNLAACPGGTPVTAEFVIGSYHRLYEIERSFRMAKSDLQARPIYHHQRDSIEAHLTIVFAALAVSRWIERQTGWSIRKFVKTARRYRTVEIQAGDHVITAADPIPDDLRQALDAINDQTSAH